MKSVKQNLISLPPLNIEELNINTPNSRKICFRCSCHNFLLSLLYNRAYSEIDEENSICKNINTIFHFILKASHLMFRSLQINQQIAKVKISKIGCNYFWMLLKLHCRSKCSNESGNWGESKKLIAIIHVSCANSQFKNISVSYTHLTLPTIYSV